MKAGMKLIKKAFVEFLVAVGGIAIWIAVGLLLVPFAVLIQLINWAEPKPATLNPRSHDASLT